MQDRVLIGDLHNYIDSVVTVAGWVHVRRDHGKLIFLDLRDRSGLVQAVALPNHAEAHTACNTLRNEWVVTVSAKVNKRPERMVKEGESNGDIELELLSVEILNEAQTPAFDITQDTIGVEEQLRLSKRYLDLRSERMQRNMRLRSSFVQACRNYLFEQSFCEIETPLLTESTPEGSRDFVVPSRLQPGKFYALPQSPQQYKQLLMTAGFERYFQIARAIRDEDLRADRGFEHTQIDIEMSFVSRDDVMATVETMVTTAVEAMGFVIKQKPFPRISYQDALSTYGADKFDLRTEAEKAQGILAYAWVIDFPQFERTDAGGWTFSHNPFSMPLPNHLDDLLAGTNIESIISSQYDLVCNGYEAGGGSIRAHKPEILEATYKIMGASDDAIQQHIGHMLDAFRSGTPPHGGIALGVERNVMNLTGETQLREVQAFPMTRGGQTAVMHAPNELSPEQLAELGLSVVRRSGDRA